MAYLYFTQAQFMTDLLAELKDATLLADNVAYAEHFCQAVFAEDIGFDAQKLHFKSISEAAKILRSHGKLWYHHPISHVRRATLIQDNFKKQPKIEAHFPPESLASMGVFSLIDQNTMIFCPKRWKNYPLGQFNFVEDKQNPPNRAYLKLWEALSLLGNYPKAGDITLDLGASPGGWSYVLSTFGSQVIAVDKAPLDPKIARIKNIKSLQQSAFALDPKDFPTVDLLVCDIACYPDRLLELIQAWMATGNVKQFICTIKLQGDTDFNAIQKFQAIPNSIVTHLSVNKHELTFFHPIPTTLKIEPLCKL